MTYSKKYTGCLHPSGQAPGYYVSRIKNELNNLPRTSFGVSVPALRALARRVARDNPRELLENTDTNDFWVKMLHAFVIGYMRDDINTLLKYFAEFVPYVDDWGINDSLCQNFKVARRYSDIVWNFLMKYVDSDKEFDSRIVSVMLLSHYLTDDYIDRVLDVLGKLNTRAYYAQMGVAWAVATAVAKYPEKTMRWLKNVPLDNATRKKTIRKICESYRVPDEIKSRVSIYEN